MKIITRLEKIGNGVLPQQLTDGHCNPDFWSEVDGLGDI